MSVFAVISPRENTKLAAAIAEKYPDNYKISSIQWVVSAKGTAKQISDTIGISAKENLIGSGIVFSISGYWGRADSNLWEWMKNKMEESENG